MKPLLKLLIGFAFLFLCVGIYSFVEEDDTSTSFSNLWVEVVDADTLTNTEADTLEFGKKYDYSSDVNITLTSAELSGTASYTAIVQQTDCNTCTDRWINTDTIATVSATGTHFINLTQDPQHSGEKVLWGYRTRVILTNSGTGVHRYLLSWLARRR